MSKDIEGTIDGLSRRSVLRRGTFVAAAATVGVGAFSMPVAASECPRTPGYWKNHDWPSTGLSRVNTIMNRVTGQTEFFASVEEGQEYLSQSKKGDKGNIMAFHLIATILNFQVTGDCYDTHAVAVDGMSVTQIKGNAEDWLRDSNFPGAVSDWYNDNNENGEPLKNYLDMFNNGNLVPCSCATDD